MAADWSLFYVVLRVGNKNYFHHRVIIQHIHVLLGCILSFYHKKNIDQAKHYTLDL